MAVASWFIFVLLVCGSLSNHQVINNDEGTCTANESDQKQGIHCKEQLEVLTKPAATTRQFTIAYDANTFLMDGKPFRYISGSFHYFRAVPGAWRERLRTMKAGGLNTLSTYVEWSLHNPEDGLYNWQGIADLERFLQLAQEIGFYVILRPGPYICAERDNGGIPYWLLRKYPNIKMRTSDNSYLYEVSIWYDKLMSLVQPYLYGNGGSIIMVQIENEYNSFDACDRDYLNWLRDKTQIYVEDKAVLFTTDMPKDDMSCGKIDGVLATIDFGVQNENDIVEIWNRLRAIQPTGPLVNSEFYSGWLTHWQDPLSQVDAHEVADALNVILSHNASVNIYMYFGGTNFGFTAGANNFGSYNYKSDITSYDYDAVLTESGKTTQKFHLIRNVIKQFTSNIPPLDDLESVEAFDYGKVQLQPVLNLLQGPENQILMSRNDIEYQSVITAKPRTFEQLGQFSGYVLYEAKLPPFLIDPALLTVNDLSDRAYVYVDNHLIGILSRENGINSLSLAQGMGTKLQIFVENQGRINFKVANDRKGILGSVTVKEDIGIGLAVTNWKHSKFSLEERNIQLLQDHVSDILNENERRNVYRQMSGGTLYKGPLVYYGEFQVLGEPMDTYLNPKGWGKGVAFINGFNLGRYWPLAGPQLTLYVPKQLIRKGNNSIILIEFQRDNGDGQENLPFISLDNNPQLNVNPND